MLAEFRSSEGFTTIRSRSHWGSPDCGSVKRRRFVQLVRTFARTMG